MSKILLYFLYYIAAVSALTFIVCAYDKFASKHGIFRIPEKVLFGISTLGGAIGMLMGMLFFRHKTNHMSFRIIIPILAIGWYAAGLLIYSYFK